MPIRELFTADITRDIPPVVYFHEQTPAKLKSEVEEYIVTGGYSDGDSRAAQAKHGIHEELVHLLQAMTREIKKHGGPELPASWISGFYGSGKSSFAKLLGLALDGAKLPDGSLLADALLKRDDSPKRNELLDAWKALRSGIDPLSVVFDIGGVARDNEHIHGAVVRQLQARLGYCPKSHLVATYELRLEIDGEWERFVEVAEQTLGKPWSKAKELELADEHFSHVLHAMMPEKYKDPMSWIDAHAGSQMGYGSSVRDAVDAIDAMRSIRAENKTIFIVVDEVSQYVHQDETRMLKLQSFVSDLGQKLKGAVWLLATGQQKLEDAADAGLLVKLKDRFPTHLRVHLHPSNIRDVVHKRLLKKAADKEDVLRKLFQTHRSDLNLNAYDCENITQEDFVEVYPMLPGHVDLLMRITSNLRARSSRVQGDAHAIRGLLQLLGELFREQKLADREVGDLVTLDAIFEVQQSALDADVQTTLHRIFKHPDVCDDQMALRAAKAVALLELIQEQTPTTAELVAKCLYARLGQGNQLQAIQQALEKLRAANLIAYSEKQGYKIQSSAGQEWQRERDDIGVSGEHISVAVRDKVKELIGMPDRPRHKNRPFPWAAFFSDGKHMSDDRVADPRDNAAVVVDFRFLGRRDDRTAETWVERSASEPLKDRILWIVGEASGIEDAARQVTKSSRMVERYRLRRESLSREAARLLLEEEARLEELEGRLKSASEEAFMSGQIYFRGNPFKPRDFGGSFSVALNLVGNRVLPDLFPHFSDIAISDTELGQLLEPTLSGPSNKFLESGLGLLSMDAGRYVASCTGAEPSRLLAHIEQNNGASGASLIQHFGRPPYGYPVDVLRACLAGLLRGHKIRVRPGEGPEITSIKDPGVRDLFRKDGDLRRADFFPAKDSVVSARDRVHIRQAFKKFLGIDIEPENDAIADAAFAHFPGKRERLRQVEAMLERVPGRPQLPLTLARLAIALEDCRRSRQVEETVLAVKKHIDALSDGLEMLGRYVSDLTEDAVLAVRDVTSVRDAQLAQLEHISALGELAGAAAEIATQLASDRPWVDVGSLSPKLAEIRKEYVRVRSSLVSDHQREADAARGRLMARPGFEKLSEADVHPVLKPLNEAMFDTTADAVSPSLIELRDGFGRRLHHAEDVANDRLDDLLAERSEAQVVKVPANMRGREVSSRDELKRVFAELEDSIGPHLDRGARVRIV